MSKLFDRMMGRRDATSEVAVIDLCQDDRTRLASAGIGLECGDAQKSPDRNFADTCPSEFPPETMSFQFAPGSMPLAPYRIRRGIGVGGFGEVYFAISEAGKEVALKRVQRNLDVELRGVSHCLNLKHPNLVSVFDICRDEAGQAWIVMEYVAGPNLRDVLDDAPQGLHHAEVRRWLTGIAAGIRHLHASGIVHRDIKPGNLFDDLGIVKVGDYGLSKFISSSHRGGHTESVGTFHYMAPEIGRGQYGREIDIYALGIVLFEMLTGTVPFDGESCHEIIVKHLTATPDLSGIPEPFRSTIARCLEKDPAKRPASVDAMLDLLGMAIPGTQMATFVSQTSSTEPVTAKLANVPANQNGLETRPTARGPIISKTTNPLDEPLARAVRHSCDDFQRWWRALDRSPGAKVFLTVVIGFVLLLNTHWLLPFLSLLGVFYVPYYIIRHMVLHTQQQPSYAEAQRVAMASTIFRPLTKIQWRSQLRSELRAKHTLVRLSELGISYVAAILATTFLAVIAGVIGLRSGAVTSAHLAPYFWMGSVVLSGAFAMLGLGKLWEREEGEGLTRRIALSGVGAGVGAFAFAMLEFLMMPVDHGLTREIGGAVLPQALYHHSGVPRASAWMAHYALLFASLRWWKPVDPLRRRRLSMWSVGVAVACEWIIQQLLPIPQPSGMLVAGGLAIVVQLSAPWSSAQWNPSHQAVVRRVRVPSQPIASGGTLS